MGFGRSYPLGALLFGHGSLVGHIGRCRTFGSGPAYRVFAWVIMHCRKLWGPGAAKQDTAWLPLMPRFEACKVRIFSRLGFLKAGAISARSVNVAHISPPITVCVLNSSLRSPNAHSYPIHRWPARPRGPNGAIHEVCDLGTLPV